MPWKHLSASIGDAKLPRKCDQRMARYLQPS